MADSLFKGASGANFRNARENRKQPTAAEKVLWEHLRNRKLNGFKFRRQHPISGFITDFYCHECSLAVEIDGGYHNDIEQKEYDTGRTFELGEAGVEVLRFKNDDVLENMDWVLEEIGRHLVSGSTPGGEKR